MNGCEMCGKMEDLFRVKIEGSLILACKRCSKFGTVLSGFEPIVEKEIEKPRTYVENEEKVVDNFSDIIRKEREKLGLKQGELAQKLNEKESVIHKIENGHMVLSLKLANKLGKFFGVKLVKVEKEESVRLDQGERPGFTLNDFMKGNRKA
jgi:putative transcription factor